MSGKEAYSLWVDTKERRERGSVLQLAAIPPVSGEHASVNSSARLSPAWWVPSTSPLTLLHLLHISRHLVLSHQVSTIHLWQQLDAQWYLCYLIILETDLTKGDGWSMMRLLVFLAVSYAFSSLFLWHLILFSTSVMGCF